MGFDWEVFNYKVVALDKKNSTLCLHVFFIEDHLTFSFWVLVVGNQIVNLIFNHFFHYNSYFIVSNEESKFTFIMYTLKALQ